MKKLVAVLLLGGLVLALAGCGNKIEVRFVFKNDPVPVVQTEPPTAPPTTRPPETTAAPETTAPNVDTGSAG